MQDVVKFYETLNVGKKQIFKNVMGDMATAAAPKVLGVLDERIAKLNRAIEKKRRKSKMFKSSIEEVDTIESDLNTFLKTSGQKENMVLKAIHSVLLDRKKDLAGLIKLNLFINDQQTVKELETLKELLSNNQGLSAEIIDHLEMIENNRDLNKTK